MRFKRAPKSIRERISALDMRSTSIYVPNIKISRYQDGTPSYSQPSTTLFRLELRRLALHLTNSVNAATTQTTIPQIVATKTVRFSKCCGSDAYGQPAFGPPLTQQEAIPKEFRSIQTCRISGSADPGSTLLLVADCRDNKYRYR